MWPWKRQALLRPRRNLKRQDYNWRKQAPLFSVMWGRGNKERNTDRWRWKKTVIQDKCKNGTKPQNGDGEPFRAFSDDKQPRVVHVPRAHHHRLRMCYRGPPSEWITLKRVIKGSKEESAASRLRSKSRHPTATEIYFASIVSTKNNDSALGGINICSWEGIEAQDEGGDERCLVTLNELKCSETVSFITQTFNDSV